jgi:hypothetical protein
LRVLIDGLAFDEPAGPESQFWVEATLGLLSQFPNGVYVLSRSSRSLPKEIERCQRLSGTPLDFQNLLIEDRRLAALCSEMQFGWFLSTTCTSAGGNVRSTFVALDSRFGRKVGAAMARAARFASLHVAATDHAASAMSRLAGVSRDQIHVLGNKDGREFAQLLIKRMDSPPAAGIEALRRAEEDLVQTAYERLRSSAQEDAETRWNRAAKRRTQFIPRVLRAIRNVRRYPEYVKRLKG